jgi:TonB family protein
MATTDRSKQDNFGLLPEEEKRFGSFGVSLVVNVLIAALAILLTISQVHQRIHQMQSTELIFPIPQPKPYVPPPPVHLPPPPKITETQPSKIIPPAPVKAPPPPPKPIHIKTPEPVLPKFRPAPPVRVAPPPKPKVGLFQSARPTTVANNRQRTTLHTGGFGDPQGVHANPNANQRPTVATVGAFQSAPGASRGAGAARQGAVHGVNFGSGVASGVPGGRSHGTVASTGFGSGVVGGTGRPGGHGRVAQPSFGGNIYGNGAAHAPAQQAQTTPIVVLWKPLPQYTAQARAEHIQGDVTLRVRFTAAGQVQVLGVVRGLGAGLDQQAIAAAEKIRFKPATRDGHPVDQVSLIRISFQMT